MKKSLLAIAAMTALAGAAQAQSSVTVYGLIDAGIMGTTNNGNINTTNFVTSTNPGNAAGVKQNGSAVGFMTGGESQSRLGFKGSEDLGGGTKAVFLLEQGFNGGNGTTGNTGLVNNVQKSANGGNIGADTSLQGQMFNRGAYVGLSNDKYGTFTAGRQQNLMLDNIGGYNPVDAQLFSPIAFSGSYGGGGQTDNSRVNNAFKYVYKNSGFNANLLYAPGGIAGNTSAGTTTGAQVGYETDKFGLQAIASHTVDSISLAGYGDSATPPTAQGAVLINQYGNYAVGLSNTTAYQLTGKYKVLDALTLKAGYEREIIGTPSNAQLFNQNTALPSGASIATISPTLGQTNLNVFWVGANYDFTPAIKGSIGYYYIGQLAGQNGGSNSVVPPGTTQYQSAMVEYYMSKRTNLYAAFMNVNTSANIANNNVYGGSATAPVTTSQTYGLGMRHTF